MTAETLVQALVHFVIAVPIGIGAYFIARLKGRRPAIYAAGTFFLAFIIPIVGGLALLWDTVRPAKKESN
ncbi:hypothetical protein [Pseudophaeobacter sp.]|jgi:hypothetical protein|uniref:hypothetical protein n=1 Tax=Pseudophaeobacter sp. TaxID=1971739 RepID=UPI0032D8E2DF